MASDEVEKLYKKKLFRSYTVDVICLLFFGILASAIEFLPPVKVVVDQTDSQVSLPLVSKEWVPNYILPIFSIGLPLVIIVSFMASKKFKRKRLWVSFLGLFLALFVCYLITNILKNTIGRPRPDFDARRDSSEQRRSFPSGHASNSFAGLGFASLFMAGQLKLLDGSAHIDRFLACLFPLILAGLIGLSRIIDHRHHWDDVFVGSLIGIGCALTSYFFYFPSLWTESCNEPRDARFKRLMDQAMEQASSSAEPEVVSKENVV